MSINPKKKEKKKKNEKDKKKNQRREEKNIEIFVFSCKKLFILFFIELLFGNLTNLFVF